MPNNLLCRVEGCLGNMCVHLVNEAEKWGFEKAKRILQKKNLRQMRTRAKAEALK